MVQSNYFRVLKACVSRLCYILIDANSSDSREVGKFSLSLPLGDLVLMSSFSCCLFPLRDRLPSSLCPCWRIVWHMRSYLSWHMQEPWGDSRGPEWGVPGRDLSLGDSVGLILKDFVEQGLTKGKKILRALNSWGCLYKPQFEKLCYTLLMKSRELPCWLEL